MPDMLLTKSDDFVLQMEVSEVTEGSVMDAFAEMAVKPTSHRLTTSVNKKRRGLSSVISAQNSENHMYRKRTWSATGNNTTDWIIDLVSLVHSVIGNLPCLMIFILI